MFRNLPLRARVYIAAVIAAGALSLVLLLPRATFTPVLSLIFFVLLSSLTSAFKVRFPIASGSNMSVSYVVDIASLMLRGPHATMIVGAVSGWTQTTFNATVRNPPYRTLFNMACLVLTVEAAGQTYQRLGGTPTVDPRTIAFPLVGMALTYFFANTAIIAVAIALTTKQSAWRIWKNEFASSAPNYLLGAGAAAVVLAVNQSSGYWLTLLLTAAPLYLTYKVYRASVDTEARQGAILEAAHDAIVTLDPQLNIREFNPAAETMFGHRRTDILGRNVGLLLPPADREVRLNGLSQYMATGEWPGASPRVEIIGLRADDTEFPVELTAARVRSDSRSVMTIFIRDMTDFIRNMNERRTLEEQLRRSQKLEAIGRLAGGVAHDFNNILMSIMGAADLILMQLRQDDSAREEATEIKLAVQRGAGLTRQLLAFSRRQASSPRLINLGEVVGGMNAMLRRLIGPEIDFEIINSPDPAVVIADRGQIEQVVLNLVINARDAMPDGGRLTITVDEVDLDEAAAVTYVEGRAGRYGRVAVSDTGTGIDDQTLARLFEPFFTTKEEGKGTGLGLSIVYGIVKQSGGYIRVVSEPGRGATFIIYLPTASIPLPDPVPAATQS